jgi:hypothetical protein
LISSTAIRLAGAARSSRYRQHEARSLECTGRSLMEAEPADLTGAVNPILVTEESTFR